MVRCVAVRWPPLSYLAPTGFQPAQSCGVPILPPSHLQIGTARRMCPGLKVQTPRQRGLNAMFPVTRLSARISSSWLLADY